MDFNTYSSRQIRSYIYHCLMVLFSVYPYEWWQHTPICGILEVCGRWVVDQPPSPPEFFFVCSCAQSVHFAAIAVLLQHSKNNSTMTILIQTWVKTTELLLISVQVMGLQCPESTVLALRVHGLLQDLFEFRGGRLMKDYMIQQQDHILAQLGS